MSDNPYENQGRSNSYSGGGGNYQRNNGGGGYNRNNNGGNNGGGRGGYGKSGGGGGRGGWVPPEYTPDQIAAAYVPLSVAFLGNEKLNDTIVGRIIKVLKMFEAKKFAIRTGAERGVPRVIIDNAMAPELHLPFKKFDGIENPASYYTDALCEEIARKMKQDIDTAPDVVKAIYAKNPRVIFGKNLKQPVSVLIIWTEDGCENPSDVTNQSGIGGHALKLAAAAGIPVINLQNADAESRVEHYLRTLYVEAQQGNRPQNTDRPRSNDAANGSNAGNYSGGAAGQQQQQQQQSSHGSQRDGDHGQQEVQRSGYGNSPESGRQYEESYANGQNGQSGGSTEGYY